MIHRGKPRQPERAETGVDIRNDRKATARLIEAAEIATIELSASTTTHVSLPFLAVVNNEPRHLDADLTRTGLERLIQPVIERCSGPVEQALRDAGMQPRDIGMFQSEQGCEVIWYVLAMRESAKQRAALQNRP